MKQVNHMPNQTRQLRTWLLAVRPWSYTGSVLAVLLGQAIAWYCGYPVKWVLFAATLAGVVCFHTAANLLNDCYDFKRGLDTEVSNATKKKSRMAGLDS